MKAVIIFICKIIHIPAENWDMNYSSAFTFLLNKMPIKNSNRNSPMPGAAKYIAAVPETDPIYICATGDSISPGK